MAVRKLKKLSVVSIFYNEEDNVQFLFDRLSRALDPYPIQKEFIFVENGSRDATFQLLMEIAKKHAHVRIVKLSRNFGHQNGYVAGLDTVSSDTDAIVMIDGDVQDPPEMIPQFIAQWEEGFDVVYGIRSKRKGNPLKILCYKLYYRILRFLTEGGFDLPQDAGEFGLFSVAVWKHLKRFPESNRLIRGLRAWVGYRQTGISYTREARQFGRSKFNLFQMFALAADGICSFSGKPLLLSFWLGFGLCSIAVLGACFAAYHWLFSAGGVESWTWSNLLVCWVGGLNLLCLGIVGEYLRRMSDQSKMRPNYIIEGIYKQSSDLALSHGVSDHLTVSLPPLN